MLQRKDETDKFCEISQKEINKWNRTVNSAIPGAVGGFGEQHKYNNRECPL